MRVAIVGAGPSGLAAARAFKVLGLDPVVFEAAPDVGGVWSATRRYPGISTQNDKHTYAFSDRRMAQEYADAPAGADVRAYLQGFVHDNGLDGLIRLGTRVSEAQPVDGGGWTFETYGPDGIGRETVDWLVVANGLFSKPYVPTIAGRAEFEAAGGRLLAPCDIGDADALAGHDVVVIGWGKSAADIAVAALPLARSVTIVARRIGWKLPRRIGRVSFQRVMLSRVGEHLIWGPHRTLAGRVLRKLTQPLRSLVVPWLGRVVATQLQLERHGLVPDVPADQLDHLISDGLLEAVDAGRIVVRRDSRVVRLSADPRQAELADGTVLAADVVVAATGYDQDLGLFSDVTRATLVDEQGDLALVRYALPATAPNLAFVGWVSSFRSPINAEIQSLWVAAVILGLLRVPPRARRRPHLFRLSHDSAAARGLSQLPHNGSFLTVDEWLSDLGLTVPAWRRRGELFGPMAPEVYADLLGRLRDRLERAGQPPAQRPSRALAR